MSDETKLMLSGDELALACNAAVILTKRSVTEKTCRLFSALIPAAQEAFTPCLAGHGTLAAAVPKISRGENYRGFPYVIMDHPAQFEKENVFAVRSMFWWGHFISVTLHLSGKYKMLFGENILKLIEDPFLVSCGEKEWEHHFEEDNFRAVADLAANEKEHLFKNSFLKIALKYDIKDWNSMSTMLPASYQKIAQLLVIN